ncbi:MAG: hypothetical protein BV456_09630 [Thermoplasmata archaeon M8B2D]|nr:MAG: hypothetical protein BV456_09630 [Thermoplasmata archaeon M8B2D]
MKAKKFNNYTNSGLGISKTGKIQVPYVYNTNPPANKTAYGQSFPIIGSFVTVSAPSGFITKNTCGKVIDIDLSAHYINHNSNGVIVIETISGKILTEWSYSAYVMTNAEYNDCLNLLKDKK